MSLVYVSIRTWRFYDRKRETDLFGGSKPCALGCIFSDLDRPQMASDGRGSFFGSECPFFGACKGTPRGKNRNTLVPFEEETKTTLVPFEEQPGAPKNWGLQKKQSRRPPQGGHGRGPRLGAPSPGEKRQIRPRSKARGLLPRRRPSALRCPHPVGAANAGAAGHVQASAPGEVLAKKGVGLKQNGDPKQVLPPTFPFKTISPRAPSTSSCPLLTPWNGSKMRLVLAYRWDP